MRNRLLTQTCDIVQLPATGETQTTQIATNLACSNPFPGNRHNWTEATDFEGLEIFTALQDGVEKGQILTVNGEKFTIEQKKERKYGVNNALGHLQLLLRRRS